MDSEKTRSSNNYHLKYASSDAIYNPLKKKKFAHVKSKVKVFIDKIKKEDREKRSFKLARYRSEPTKLATSAQWEVSLPDDGRNEVMESSPNWKLLLREKDKEVEQMKNYADSMHKMLLNERTETSKLRHQLDEVRVQLHHSHAVTFQTTDCHFYSSESVGNRGDVESVEGDMESDNDATLLLQVSSSTVQHKNMKNRFKKIFRCCAPCIKNKEIDKDKEA